MSRSTSPLLPPTTYNTASSLPTYYTSTLTLYHDAQSGPRTLLTDLLQSPLPCFPRNLVFVLRIITTVVATTMVWSVVGWAGVGDDDGGAGEAGMGKGGGGGGGGNNGDKGNNGGNGNGRMGEVYGVDVMQVVEVVAVVALALVEWAFLVCYLSSSSHPLLFDTPPNSPQYFTYTTTLRLPPTTSAGPTPRFPPPTYTPLPLPVPTPPSRLTRLSPTSTLLYLLTLHVVFVLAYHVFVLHATTRVPVIAAVAIVGLEVGVMNRVTGGWGVWVVGLAAMVAVVGAQVVVRVVREGWEMGRWEGWGGVWEGLMRWEWGSMEWEVVVGWVGLGVVHGVKRGVVRLVEED
ncbi:hypothetical protein EX30DRAFT_375090 [Ascodesmis nigricans]|uniref:Uncharacterized protein n=1 Tax=Ascodesmis nigricans TaxID=341454 RepID=A0A4S2MIY3_9PEZI|nr:hypothetical protein EX30DRAFT_375090 [Ascodesmis nigricans]